MNLPNVERDLRIGIEIEYVARQEAAAPLTRRGKFPDGTTRDLALHHIDPPGGFESTEEAYCNKYGDLGVEIRTTGNGVPYRDAPTWYETVIDDIEAGGGEVFEPVGFVDETTAGLHIHISPLSQDEAMWLYELSQQPWMWALAGSSLCEETGRFPVIRSHGTDKTYIEFNGEKYVEESSPGLFGGARYHNNAVNKRGDGHYEWRIPEPMTFENFDLVIAFLAHFVENPERAAGMGRAWVMEADDRLTSFQRAREIGAEPLQEAAVATEATDIVAGVA